MDETERDLFSHVKIGVADVSVSTTHRTHPIAYYFEMATVFPECFDSPMAVVDLPFDVQLKVLSRVGDRLTVCRFLCDHFPKERVPVDVVVECLVRWHGRIFDAYVRALDLEQRADVVLELLDRLLDSDEEAAVAAEEERKISSLALVEAARRGHVEAVRGLLPSSRERHRRQRHSPPTRSDYEDALCVAAREGRMDVVRLLLDEEALVDVDCDDGNPLCCAIEGGHEAVVRMLLERGADLHRRDGTTLVMAAREGHETLVTFLLDRGFNPTCDRGNALIWAARNGHAAVARMLLGAGTPFHALHVFNAFTAASVAGHTDLASELSERLVIEDLL